jgi:hypothetical protein
MRSPYVTGPVSPPGLILVLLCYNFRWGQGLPIQACHQSESFAHEEVWEHTPGSPHSFPSGLRCVTLALDLPKSPLLPKKWMNGELWTVCFLGIWQNCRSGRKGGRMVGGRGRAEEMSFLEPND